MIRVLSTAACIATALAAPSQNIVQLAAATPDLSTLVSALEAGNLTTALSGAGPFTVFAPQNEAFAKLPSEILKKLLDPKNVKELDDVLTYHVIAGAAVHSTDLKPKQSVKTLEGEPVIIEVHDKNVYINKRAKVTTADVDATNGVVHIIDTVLIPHHAPPSPSQKNIVEIAEATADLSTLVTALTAGHLTKALSSQGTFTVFAPTNEAFGKLPRQTLQHLLDPRNIKELDAVLEYHVLEGAAIYAKDLKPEQEVKTIEGSALLIEKRESGVYINREAKVTTADVGASNGVVHIIDTVLVPHRH